MNDFVYPVASGGALLASSYCKQPVVLQLLCSWIGRSIINESKSTAMKNFIRFLISSQHFYKYIRIIRLLILIPSRLRPKLSWNNCMEIAGFAHLGFGFISDAVFNNIRVPSNSVTSNMVNNTMKISEKRINFCLAIFFIIHSISLNKTFNNIQ